jgi:hypothetical protein
METMHGGIRSVSAAWNERPFIHQPAKPWIPVIGTVLTRGGSHFPADRGGTATRGVLDAR